MLIAAGSTALTHEIEQLKLLIARVETTDTPAAPMTMMLRAVSAADRCVQTLEDRRI
jgi:hypothetical protein